MRNVIATVFFCVVAVAAGCEVNRFAAGQRAKDWADRMGLTPNGVECRSEFGNDEYATCAVAATKPDGTKVIIPLRCSEEACSIQPRVEAQ